MGRGERGLREIIWRFVWNVLPYIRPFGVVRVLDQWLGLCRAVDCLDTWPPGYPTSAQPSNMFYNVQGAQSMYVLDQLVRLRGQSKCHLSCITVYAGGGRANRPIIDVSGPKSLHLSCPSLTAVHCILKTNPLCLASHLLPNHQEQVCRVEYPTAAAELTARQKRL